MHTADNAVIVRDNGNTVTFRARCPECGHVRNDYFCEETEAVNPTGKTISSFHKCPKCGASFKINFYGM